jgi:hypothetical protein
LSEKLGIQKQSGGKTWLRYDHTTRNPSTMDELGFIA